MATAREHMAADIAVLLADDGEAAELVMYNESLIPAIIHYMEESQVHGSGGHKMFDAAEMLVQSTDVAAPAYGDLVMINDETWKMIRILSRPPGAYWLRIERNRRRTP